MPGGLRGLVCLSGAHHDHLRHMGERDRLRVGVDGRDEIGTAVGYGHSGGVGKVSS